MHVKAHLYTLPTTSALSCGNTLGFRQTTDLIQALNSSLNAKRMRNFWAKNFTQVSETRKSSHKIFCSARISLRDKMTDLLSRLWQTLSLLPISSISQLWKTLAADLETFCQLELRWMTELKYFLLSYKEKSEIIRHNVNSKISSIFHLGLHIQVKALSMNVSWIVCQIQIDLQNLPKFFNF